MGLIYFPIKKSPGKRVCWYDPKKQDIQHRAELNLLQQH